ncbi:unnamed protein product [Ostreobium quekettii]|uniref:Uncharacterized protein n=1 Tax=Ostreobium quekettii TaxID=121088 RepID=A0A8S1J2Z3_9CHLO|nr:unnamed protein product [Ostreobium quekettii]
MHGRRPMAAFAACATAVLLLLAVGCCGAAAMSHVLEGREGFGGRPVASLVGLRPQRIIVDGHSSHQHLSSRKVLQDDEDLVEELHEAAEDGDVDEVKRLIPLVGNVDAVDDRGDTALIIAADYGQVAVMRVLLDAGADINHQGQIGSTALWAAVSMDQEESVLFLIREGADVELRSDDGATPLQIAAEDGNLRLVRALLDGGADVDGRYYMTGETPLIGATFRLHADVVDLLLERGANVEARTSFGYTSLHIAAAQGALDIFKVLVDAGADIKAVAWGNGDTVLIAAAEFHGVDVVTLLVQNGAEVQAKNKFGRTALHTAALFPDNINVLTLLLRQRLSVDAETEVGVTPVGDAAFMGNLGNVKFLLSEGGKMDDGVTAVCGCMDTEDDEGAPDCPAGNCETEDDIKELNEALGILPPKTLLEAVKAGNLTAVEAFIEAGADVEAIDGEGNTPLIFAAVRGLDGIARALIQAGADIAAENNDGQTALGLAAFFGHRDIIEILLALGAEVDHQDIDGYAALHFAAEQGHLEAVEALLDADANVDLKEFSIGATPIIVTAGASPPLGAHYKILMELIDVGAETRINGQGDLSALHAAAVNLGSQSIMQVLIDEGGMDINAVTSVGSTPLDYAAYYGNTAGAEFLLHKGADPSAGKQSDVCGCRLDEGIEGLRPCPLGACQTDAQVQELREVLGRGEAAPGTQPDSSIIQGVFDEVDCRTIADAVAQLECVASGGLSFRTVSRG